MFSHSIFTFCLLVLAFIIFVPALIIGSIGAHRLTTIRQQQNLYTNTTCYVTNVTEEILPYDCNCDGCHPTNCYAEHFAVRYIIENGTMIAGMIDINQIPYLLPMQSYQNYTCYYYRNDVRSVLWSKPSERPAMTMLIVGFSIVGLILVSVIIGQAHWLINSRLEDSNIHMRF